MDKVTAIKIRYADNTYSEKIPFTVLAKNVEWNENKSLSDILGTVDLNKNIQDQITQLYNNKVNSIELSNYIDEKINNNISSWLDQNVEPVGSAVIVNKTLDVPGAAADAKTTGDQINNLKQDIILSSLSIAQIADIKINNWEKGVLSLDDGSPVSSQICLYTPNFYVISPSASIDFLGEKTNHQYYIYFYNNKRIFINRSKDYSSIPEEAAFVRFTYGFTSASGITIDSYGGINKVIADWKISYTSPLNKAILNTKENALKLYKQFEWELGGYNTTSNIVRQTDYDQVERVKINTVQNEKYQIKSHGSAAYATWATTNKNFQILRKSSDIFTDEIITINSNEDYLFVNALKNDEHFIYLLQSDATLSTIKENQKNIENNFQNYKEDIYNYTQNKRIESWINNKYLPCDTSPVNILNPQENQTNWRYTILECKENDTFTITVRGGSIPKAWCFLDINYNILTKSSITTLLENQVIVAPKNSAYLILNDTYKQGISYYGEFLYKALNKKINTITTIDNICPIVTATRTAHGITYTPINQIGYKVNGTADAASYYLLFNSNLVFPENIIPGNTYYVDYKTSNLKVQFQILTYINGVSTTIATLNHSGWFTIPQESSGLVIRLYVGNGTKVENLIVCPKIYNINSLSYIKLIKDKTTKPMLSIIYDDGHLDFKNYIMPIIASKKVPIATAIVPEMIEENISSLMTWNQIIECYNNGAEVLTHFKSYPEAEWENFDSQDLSYRYLKSRNQIYSHGIHTPNVLVFSGASSKTPVARRAAMRIFNGGFNASHGGINYYNHIDPYFINRYGTDNETLETLKGWIDNLIAQGTGWMVWTRHNSNATSEDQTIAAQILSNAIDYALSLNIQIVTIERGIAEYLDMY